ncbi:unnamed protein product [Taenia asiatica]|uniref:Ovule protein n=1 Tax=Taenia asiatica TaxID=60517 RepID=A0A0R3WFV4_TAEAS|nr:unnamed protein product [Taenia asiatica]
MNHSNHRQEIRCFHFSSTLDECYHVNFLPMWLALNEMQCMEIPLVSQYLCPSSSLILQLPHNYDDNNTKLCGMVAFVKRNKVKFLVLRSSTQA